MGLNHIKHEIPSGGTCALIFPDRGERYLETIFCDSWVRNNFEHTIGNGTDSGKVFCEGIHDPQRVTAPSDACVRR
jgi:hypothetical protein